MGAIPKFVFQIFHVAASARDNMVNVFATDYTKPVNAYPLTSEQWPPPLDPYILKFEFWDAASAAARLMIPGELYYVSNARLRSNTGGYMEGKVVENKVTLLDPYEADSHAFLRDLLE